MRPAFSILMYIYQSDNPCDDSPFHILLEQNYIQSLRVLLNITSCSANGLLGMRNDLFCEASRLSAFYRSERPVNACGMLSIFILTGGKPGATKDRNLRSFYVSVSHAKGGAYVISGPAWGLPSGCSPRRLFRHHISRLLP